MQREFKLKRLRLFAISPMAVVHKKNFTFRHVKILLLSDLLSLNHIKTWKCIKMFSYQIINYKYLVSDNYLCYKQLQFWIKSKSASWFQRQTIQSWFERTRKIIMCRKVLLCGFVGQKNSSKRWKRPDIQKRGSW